MEISGLVQSYDNRVSTAAPQPRAIMAPQFVQQPYSNASSSSLTAPQSQQNPFYSPFPAGNSSVIVPIPAFTTSYTQRLGFGLPRLTHVDSDLRTMVPYNRNIRQGFVEEPSQSPSNKEWNSPTSSPTFGSNNVKNGTAPSPIRADPSEATFKTEVDILMKVVQSKPEVVKPQTMPTKIESVVGGSHNPYVHCVSQEKSQQQRQLKLTHSEHQDDEHLARESKKRWKCTVNKCRKKFHQKTHLDIHERKHTGDKPYPCLEPGCGRHFSQQGNLKTHQRRHTGEKPYACDICGKHFAQLGNVRAHKVIHGNAKPFICLLKGCDKYFSQLGNLKSHQNKFHADSIRELTSKFASLKPGDYVEPADQALWDYFADLYKNSNKGIKGRGKDRTVSNSNSNRNRTAIHEMEISRGSFALAAFGQGNMVSHGGLKTEGQYDMFDNIDGDSQSGQSTSSSDRTMYDDEYDSGRGSDAFGDRHGY